MINFIYVTDKPLNLDSKEKNMNNKEYNKSDNNNYSATKYL